MTTTLIVFVIALVVSNALVPVAKRMGVKLGALDVPNERKVHTEPIPRSGGLAIFVSFLATICVSKIFMPTLVTDLIVWNQEMLFLLAGASVCFGIGLFDDFKRLGPKVKLIFQIIGASLAYIGGAKIGDISFFEISLVHFPVLSYCVTVFWFLLFMNAVNLIDGLDGLAGGIVVFTSVVMVILSILRLEYLSGVYFSILAGSVLGFLRYNFNPASIFLGDGGSYFLGYAIAALSILGSTKAQTSAAVAIPLLALGVPLFDTILSPIRRFIIGKKMFRPDKGHVHHRLIEMGMTARKAVLVIYGLTFGLCVFAMLITNIRDERAGLFLIILGCGVAVLVRKLGYFEYIASDKFYGWFQDMSDQTGFRHERRSFLSHQVDIAKANTIEKLWKCLEKTAVFLELDFLELTVCEKTAGGKTVLHVYSFGELNTQGMDWDSAMHIKLPLASKKTQFGSLAVSKNIIAVPLTPFTLRRIEQLRRTVVEVLQKIEQEQGDVEVYGKTG